MQETQGHSRDDCLFSFSPDRLEVLTSKSEEVMKESVHAALMISVLDIWYPF